MDAADVDRSTENRRRLCIVVSSVLLVSFILTTLSIAAHYIDWPYLTAESDANSTSISATTRQMFG